MAERKPQTRENHRRTDPAFHFFLVPPLLSMFIWTGIRLFSHPNQLNAILFILVILMTTMAFRMRIYSLKVQDRVIRLEERLRLMASLPVASQSIIPQLSERQLTALRFASDTELPALAERAARENLSSKQIKDAIQNWRPDYWRV
jgi:hypothetical protein